MQILTVLASVLCATCIFGPHNSESKLKVQLQRLSDTETDISDVESILERDVRDVDSANKTAQNEENGTLLFDSNAVRSTTVKQPESTRGDKLTFPAHWFAEIEKNSNSANESITESEDNDQMQDFAVTTKSSDGTGAEEETESGGSDSNSTEPHQDQSSTQAAAHVDGKHASSSSLFVGIGVAVLVIIVVIVVVIFVVVRKKKVVPPKV
uniref:Uncharacterized protein n=1 Tax=Romanomermis culicivorax TaxID=13658 RepID=A0A915HF44_ROMCU